VEDNELSVSDIILNERKNLVHFSSKSTNSNAQYLGIRVGMDMRLNLPYVSVRCMAGRAPLDRYTIKMGGMSEIILNIARGKSMSEAVGVVQEKADKQVQKNERDRLKKETGIKHLSPEQKDKIKGMKGDIGAKAGCSFTQEDCDYLVEARNTTDRLNVDRPVDVRLRQILLPNNPAGYLGVVPLQSIPLSDKARDLMWEIRSPKEADTDKSDGMDLYRILPCIEHPVGGAASKKHNVGLGMESRQFIVMGFYRKNAEASRKASVSHRGVASRLNNDKETLEKYARFIERCDWSSHEKKAHTGYVSRIVHHYLKQAAQLAHDFSDAEIDDMDSDLDKGLLDASRRGPVWVDIFVDWAYQKMIGVAFAFHQDGQPKYLSGVHRGYLRKIIREVVS
jgi:hypothetical protein